MGQLRIAVPFTTDQSGEAEVVTQHVRAAVNQIYIHIIDLPSGGSLDLEVAEHDTGLDVLNVSDVEVSTAYRPRVPVVDAAGTEIEGGFTFPVVDDDIVVAISNADPGVSGVVYLYLDGVAIIELPSHLTETALAHEHEYHDISHSLGRITT